MLANYAQYRHQSVKSFLQEALREAIRRATMYLDDFVMTRNAESLHQYRVYLRLARSVALEFGAFMEENHKIFLLDTFKIVQKKSNSLRDSDVFLASLETYEAWMRSDEGEEFSTLKEQIQKEREASLRLFLSKKERAFRQKTITQLLQGIEDEAMYLPLAEESVRGHAEMLLRKRLKKIAKLSAKLSLKSPNDDFHALRLHCKKLRYTAEALHLDSFCRSFKPIQSAFGDVQDKNSQIERLKRYTTQDCEALEPMVSHLEKELLEDKKVCLKKTRQKILQKMSQKLEKIFTCKKR